jgi:fructokinase
MPDIISIGEALIDFLSVDKGVDLEAATGFTFAPGGAPANVAAAVAKLDGKSGFIGKVGDDSFGRIIKNTLSEVGVNIDLLVMDKRVNTTLAFIAVKPNGEPDFTFYRNHCGADLAFRQDELDEGYIHEAKILHFGSISFTGEPLRSATIRAIQIARGSNKVISFDPNLRPSLWESLRTAKSEMEMGLQYADIVKMTEEELEFITGTKNLTKGTEVIIKYGPRMVIVTRGGRSCFFNNGNISCEVPAFEVKPVDTTGGGDAFVGGFLLQIVKRIEEDMTIFNMREEEVREILTQAHACGAIAVTKIGVIPSLPTSDEVAGFLIKYST